MVAKSAFRVQDTSDFYSGVARNAPQAVGRADKICLLLLHDGVAMTLKQTIQSSLKRDSISYRLLRTIYRYRKPHALRRGIAMRLSRDSRFDASELWMASFCPKGILDAVVNTWSPRSCLDVGCGTGRTLEYLSLKGIDCVGLEGSTAAIRSSPVRELILCVNLNNRVTLGRKFDLVWSFEVAEHIHPRYVEVFLDTLTEHGHLIVMSAAPPGQGGAGHFNEQPARYWVKKLAERNFQFQKAFSEYLHGLNDPFSANMMVFRRG